MRFQAFVLPLLAAVSTVIAEPQAVEASGPRETALDNLLSERGSPDALAAAIAAARRSGVCEQAILEARFLYHVDLREDAAIAALLPEFLKMREAFKIEDSSIFSVKEDWLAVIEYVQSIAALEKGDKAAFKTHITEAFWLSPRQAAAFTPHIERLRLEENMRGVKLDFGLKFVPLNSGDPVALQALLTGKKALLLHFWSPLSPECEAAMPDFVAMAMALSDKGIAVASILPDDSPKTLTDARAMIRPLGDKPPGAWLIDSKVSIGNLLHVRNLPAVVLVSADGGILYNGDPTDEQYWDELRKIDVNISRPASALQKER